MAGLLARFYINITEIKIFDQSRAPLQLKGEFTRALKFILSNIANIKEMKKIDIYIKEGTPLLDGQHSGRRATAKYLGNDVGNFKFFINQFIRKDKTLDMGELTRVAIHEARHFHDGRKNELKRYTLGLLTSQRFKAITIRQVRLLRKYNRKNIDSFWTCMRVILFNFLQSLFSEGLAEYCSRHYPFSEIEFNKLHKEAIAAATLFRSRLEKDIRPIKSGDKISDKKIEEIKYLFIRAYNKFSYDIGAHMVYTIKYVFDTTLREFDFMTVPHFIKLYLAACARRGITPVVGYTSQDDGIFNYGKYLQEIYPRR